MYFDAKATGERVRQLRLEKRMTQERLGNELNISEGHLRKLENGNSAGSIDLLVDIAVYFEISLDYLLLGRTDTPGYAKQEIRKAIKILSACVEEGENRSSDGR